MKRLMIFVLCVLAPMPFLLSVEHPLNEMQQTDLTPPEIPHPEMPSAPDVDEPIYPIDMHKLDMQNERFFSELINMLATLGLIIAFLLIVAWFLKRLMNTRIEQMNVNSQIKIIERRVLSQKSSLYLIEIEGKSILITEAQNGGSSALELGPVSSVT